MEWIRNLEDLWPEDNVDVIVYYECVNGVGDAECHVSTARRIGAWSVAEGDLGGSYWDIELTGIDNRVLYWMPFPPIPKKRDLWQTQ